MSESKVSSNTPNSETNDPNRAAGFCDFIEDILILIQTNPKVLLLI